MGGRVLSLPTRVKDEPRKAGGSLRGSRVECMHSGKEDLNARRLSQDRFRAMSERYKLYLSSRWRMGPTGPGSRRPPSFTVISAGGGTGPNFGCRRRGRAGGKPTAPSSEQVSRTASSKEALRENSGFLMRGKDRWPTRRSAHSRAWLARTARDSKGSADWDAFRFEHDV